MSESALLISPVERQIELESSQEGFRLGKISALDGLRGISILLVIGHHARLSFSRGGFLGVDLFFVLSGFLITALLLQEWDRTGSISLKRFYIRRGLRLLPALITLLAALSLYAAVFLRGEAASGIYKASLITLAYQSNWAEAFGLTSLGVLYHTWSLSIEEQFYLLWPLSLILMLRLNMKRSSITLIVVMGFAASMVYRAILLGAGTPVARLYNGLDTRADSLLMGCAVALLATLGFVPRTRKAASAVTVATIPLIFIALYLIATASSDGAYLYLGGFTVISSAAALLIVRLIAQPSGAVRRALEWGPLVWVGKLSYGLYLWNFPVCYILSRPGWPRAASVPLQILGTFATASLSFYLIEKPFLRVKNRFSMS